MTPPSAIRLLIADRQEMFREGLKSALTEAEGIVVVGEADDEQSVLDAFDPLSVDMILLDVEISGGTNPHIIQRLRDIAADLSVVIVTARHDSALWQKALQMGADGFLSRSAKSATFVDALRTVSKGHHYIEPELAATLVEVADPSLQRINERLSTRQLRILQLVTQGLGNRQIANETSLSETTIKSELRFIYAQLGASNRAEAAATALRVGLVD